MASSIQILLSTILCLQVAKNVSATFFQPSFDSDWLLMIAEDVTYSFRAVSHNLGEVPRLVDVTVRPVSGPNEDFVFKGVGETSHDDDQPSAYGGVVYIYDNTTVNLYLPKGNNHGTANGQGINTGLSPHWTGVNTQQDRVVMVRVRCWKADVLPEPCFTKTDIPIQAGSTNSSLTFIEEKVSFGKVPDLVKVRAKMLDTFAGWYTDAQGTAQANLDRLGFYGITGGIISAFDSRRVRVWTSSNKPYGSMFGVDDGWGGTGTHNNQARSGLVEMYAWCTLGTSRFTSTFEIGAGVGSETLEQPINISTIGWGKDAFVSVTVKVTDGVNDGLYFDGIGAATELVSNFGQPCSFGGLVFGYSDAVLRIWRPSSIQGAIICVPEKFGSGIGTQAARKGVVRIVVWTIEELTVVQEPIDPAGCGEFWLHHGGAGYIDSGSTDVKVYANVTSLHECTQTCLSHGGCVTFSYDANEDCAVTESAVGVATLSVTSQIWTRVDLNVTISAGTTAVVTTTMFVPGK